MNEDYNYQNFVIKGERPHFERFMDTIHVGTVAPNYPLEDLATGATVTMKEIWSKGVVLAEFGSFT